jgi:hypothetical protein
MNLGIKMLTLRRPGQRTQWNFPHYLCNFSADLKLFENKKFIKKG